MYFKIFNNKIHLLIREETRNSCQNFLYTKYLIANISASISIEFRLIFNYYYPNLLIQPPLSSNISSSFSYNNIYVILTTVLSIYRNNVINYKNQLMKIQVIETLNYL